MNAINDLTDSNPKSDTAAEGMTSGGVSAPSSESSERRKNSATVTQNATLEGADQVNKENKTDKKSHDKPPKKGLKKSTIWTLRITVVTLILSCFFSFVSELASTKAHFSIMIILLFFLIALSIAADAVGVAATSCDLAPLLAMASRKEPGSKQAIMLVKNAERVSNICCDVIGDICSIVSGACTLAIVIKITEGLNETVSMVISIVMSGIVSAITVGGKSMFKNVAVNNSKELIILVARVLSVFSPKERKEKAKQKQKLEKAKNEASDKSDMPAIKADKHTDKHAVESGKAAESAAKQDDTKASQTHKK